VKIIFAGTPHFAASALAALLKEHRVVAVLTQPDRPAGRGMQLVASPVKQLALQHGLAVLQPTTLRTEEAQHVIAALDVFTYIGCLDVVIPNAYHILLPGARLVFSCETGAEGAADYALPSSYRYTHQRSYVQRLLRAAGFQDIVLED